ncbi:hypothetical protein AOLI_G00148050 [Acnodon oligacanthus]
MLSPTQPCNCFRREGGAHSGINGAGASLGTAAVVIDLETKSRSRMVPHLWSEVAVLLVGAPTVTGGEEVLADRFLSKYNETAALISSRRPWWVNHGRPNIKRSWTPSGKTRPASRPLLRARRRTGGFSGVCCRPGSVHGALRESGGRLGVAQKGLGHPTASPAHGGSPAGRRTAPRSVVAGVRRAEKSRPPEGGSNSGATSAAAPLAVTPGVRPALCVGATTPGFLQEVAFLGRARSLGDPRPGGAGAVHHLPARGDSSLGPVPPTGIAGRGHKAGRGTRGGVFGGNPLSRRSATY